MEPLACEMPFEDFIDPTQIKEIVDSRNFRDGEWSRLTYLTDSPDGSHKRVVPVDTGFYHLFVITNVAPGKIVDTHQHDEAILRYVVSGSFTINGEKYSAGEWVVVPANYPYRIETKDGYTVVAGYGQACTCNDC